MHLKIASQCNIINNNTGEPKSYLFMVQKLDHFINNFDNQFLIIIINLNMVAARL